MDKRTKPTKPRKPTGPRKPNKFSDKDLIKFTMSIKAYKEVKQKDTDDGLELCGMPVFKAGKHRDFDYTTAWIDKFLIGQFDASEDIPIQRDHSDESYATLGYVKKLYRDGDMVLSDMLLIDETAISRWKKGLMKKWSIGISREFKLAEISAVAFPYIREARVHSDGDKKENPSNILTIIPTSGTEYKIANIVTSDLGESQTFTSAYENLMNVSNSNNTTVWTFSGPNLLSTSFSDGVFTINKEGDLKLDIEQLREEKESLEKTLGEQNLAVIDLNQKLSEKDKEIENYKKAKADAEFAQLKTSVEAEVKELIREGKVAPAREKALVESMCKMSDDSRKEVVQTFKESGKIAELDEHGYVKVEKEHREFKDGEGKFEFEGKVYDVEDMDVDAINDLASTYAKKHDLGFKEAMDVIFEKAYSKSSS